MTNSMFVFLFLLPVVLLAANINYARDVRQREIWHQLMTKIEDDPVGKETSCKNEIIDTNKTEIEIDKQNWNRYKRRHSCFHIR